MHQAQIWKQSSVNTVRRFWNKITTPNANITQPYLRQRASLLASLFLIIGAVLMVALVLRFVLLPINTSSETWRLGTMFFAIVVMVISYRACINGKPNFAVIFSLYTMEIVIVLLVLIIGASSLWLMSYQLVLLILVGLFAKAGSALRLFAFQLVATAIVGISAKGTFAHPAVVEPLNFMLIAGTSLLSALVYANYIQRKQIESLKLSEQKTLAAIQSSIDPFFLLSAVRNKQGELIDYRIDGGNTAAAQMSGKTPEALVGQHVIATFPSAVELGLIQRYNKVLETGERLEEEYYLADLDMWRHVQIVKVGDGLALTSREITERKRTEIKLLEQEAILKQITENVEDIFYIIDARTSRMIYVSPNFYRICSVPLEEFSTPDQIYLNILHPDDRPNFIEALKVQREIGTPINMECRIIDKIGQVHWMWLRNFPTYDESGHLMRYVGIAKDVTARREAEQQRISLGLERERLEVMRGFVSDISHDLMTPLTVIRTSLYLMSKQQDPTARAERAQRIEQQVDRLHQMISDMLMLTRLERSIHDEFHFEMQNLNTFLIAIASDFQGIAREKDLTITLATTFMPEVLLDVNKFQRAIGNILNNAVKFTPAGGIIDISTAREHHYGVIRITDSGAGIPPQDLPRIFERFYRVDKSRTDGGSGLGLAITQKIIEAHQGTIHVESQLGQGTSFVIKLPLQEPEQSMLV